MEHVALNTLIAVCLGASLLLVTGIVELDSVEASAAGYGIAAAELR